MAGMESFADKHAAKIRGTLGCFDRVLFRGYLPLMSGFAMAEFFRSERIERFTLKPFLLEQAEQIKKHAGVMVSQTGRPYQYLSEPARKEDLARKIAERDGIREGFVCVFSVVEPCRRSVGNFVFVSHTKEPEGRGGRNGHGHERYWDRR